MSGDKKGKVWLVGAGPSDSGLFTLKGKYLLERADVVVCDKLIGRGVMAMIPDQAEIIYVGKTAGHHTVPQREINRILLEQALAGKRVVRLKGGDPFVFGRGGEELELLAEEGIPFEIVPGITSAVAVPAYNGIPVTHRDCCSALHIITGHRKASEEEEIDYEALVRAGGTMVFLMGVTAMGKICGGLLKAGMDKDTPAAILDRGTTAHQRRVVSTVGKLPADSEKEGIKPPAVIIVGEVCALAERFHWAEDRPLGKMKIAVTRPRDRSSTLAEKLAELGAEVVLLPSVATQPFRENKRLREALDHTDNYRWIVFTSPVGVKTFFRTMKEMGKDIRSLAGISFGVIGEGTKKAVEEKGILVELMPEVYSGKALGELLARTVSKEERILIPRAAAGTEDVIIPLRKEGIAFDDIPVYDTLEGADSRGALWDETMDMAVFTSASTVRGFVKMNPQADFSSIRAVCIGEQTAAAARQQGMKVEISDKATIDSLVDKIREIAG